MKQFKLSVTNAELLSKACVCANAQRAARTIGRRYDAAFRRLLLTNGQFTIMLEIFRLGTPTISGLARALASDRTTINANLKPLVSRMLVSVARDLEDRRVRRVSLTPSGCLLLKKAFVVWDALQSEIAKAVGASTIETFRGTLRTIAQLQEPSIERSSRKRTADRRQTPSKA